MATLKAAQVKQVNVYDYTATAAPAITGWYNKVIDNAERTRFALMVMLLLINTCWGSVAMAYAGFDAPVWMMAMVVFPAILSNTFTIAQTSMKVIIPAFVISILMSAIVIAISI